MPVDLFFGMYQAHLLAGYPSPAGSPTFLSGEPVYGREGRREESYGLLQDGRSLGTHR